MSKSMRTKPYESERRIKRPEVRKEEKEITQ